jgi:hypothetical protein
MAHPLHAFPLLHTFPTIPTPFSPFACAPALFVLPLTRALPLPPLVLPPCLLALPVCLRSTSLRLRSSTHSATVHTPPLLPSPGTRPVPAILSTASLLSPLVVLCPLPLPLFLTAFCLTPLVTIPAAELCPLLKTLWRKTSPLLPFPYSTRPH